MIFLYRRFMESFGVLWLMHQSYILKKELVKNTLQTVLSEPVSDMLNAQKLMGGI